MSGSEEKGKAREDGGWLHVFSDGAARGNPGPAGIGGRALDERGRLLVEVCDFLGGTTNNVAEYYALIRILEESGGLGYRRVKIHTDSELLANQLTGGFKVKSAALKPLLGRLKSLLSGFTRVEVESIPREKNTACDAIANRAIEEGLAGRKRAILEPGDRGFFDE